MFTALLLLAGSGCTDTDTTTDSAAAPYDGCVVSETRSVAIGQLGGSLFTPFVDDQVVRLEAAPQGGQGVSVAVRVGGLKADAPADVLLEPYLEGVVQGSFVSEGLTLYCTSEDNGDQYGRIWGTVVGFDPAIYVTDDDLAGLDGKTVDLLVGVTDEEGNYAEGHVDVEIEF